MAEEDEKGVQPTLQNRVCVRNALESLFPEIGT